MNPLNYSVHRQGYDLLDDLGGAVQVDQTLVDAHLEAIPRLGTFSAGGLARSDTQNFGGHAHRPFDLQVLLLSAFDQICAY